MKTQQFNLDREFIKWFYEQPYPELGSNRSRVAGDSLAFMPDTNTRDYWMRQAFKAGAESMWQDINSVLADWACAVEGLDPEMLEPCEVYDRARENLHYYVNKQLQD